MGCGLSWARTACPRGRTAIHLGAVGESGDHQLQQNSKDGKVNVGVQRGAAHPRMVQSQVSARAGMTGRRHGFSCPLCHQFAV